jgi:hypothetical protein
LAVFLSPPLSHSAPLPSAKGSADFAYDIQVFWITQAARGRLRIEHLGGDHYRAELLAVTEGVVRWITGDRTNHYTSEMVLDPATGHLKSRLFSRLVFRGKNTERTTAKIDDKNRVVKWKFFANDKLVGQGSDPIPEGVQYEDLLSAFFNFRNGQFGPLAPGGKMTVYTLPDYRAIARGKMDPDDADRIQKFQIRIADRKKEKAYRLQYDRTKEKGVLALIKVPKDIFGQETGEIRVWFDTSLTPVAATVEDAYYFGDVHGAIIKPAPGR